MFCEAATQPVDVVVTETVAAAPLFQRGGQVGTVSGYDESGRPFQTVRPVCSRCGGQGGADVWKHTGWTCYKCSGTCVGEPIQLRLYTEVELAKLNATAAKRQASKAAKIAVIVAEKAAAADLHRTAFLAQHGEAVAWLRATCGEDEDSFLAKMLRLADRDAAWTEGQSTAVYAAIERSRAREAVKAASCHVGTVGERVTLEATVIRFTHFERPSFSASWKTEVVYVVTMRDTAGNTLVSKTPSFGRQVGTKLTLVATVKAHDDYKGEAQTVLSRIKVKAETAPEVEG